MHRGVRFAVRILVSGGMGLGIGMAKAENGWTDLAWNVPPAPLHVFSQQPLRFSVRITATTAVKLEWNYDLFATGGPVAAPLVKQTAITPVEEKIEPNG